MNPSKNKGTAYETAVVRYARDNGFPQAERIALHGAVDMGDVRLTIGVIAECKAYATYSDADVREWLMETNREKRNSGAAHALLVIKRARHSIASSWAVHGHHNSPLTPVYMHLSDALLAYRYEGYGDPLD